jgi:hypothetical protein
MRYSRDESEFDRAIAFVDGTFAVALTLLITTLDIEDRASSFASLSALADAVGPQFITFLVAFAVISGYWLMHHRMVASFVAIDTPTHHRQPFLIADRGRGGDDRRCASRPDRTTRTTTSGDRAEDRSRRRRSRPRAGRQADWQLIAATNNLLKLWRARRPRPSTRHPRRTAGCLTRPPASVPLPARTRNRRLERGTDRRTPERQHHAE